MSTPTTTFTWAVSTLEGDLSDGFADWAHYTVTAVSSETDSNGIAYSDGAYGELSLERPEILVPFDDLPKADVVAAVKATLGAEKVTEIEQALEARIAKKIAPIRFNAVPSGWT
tara:strand:- start:117 stop:458 length:342 start_codon:yes stop_codon:yes gene_type:complete